MSNLKKKLNNLNVSKLKTQNGLTVENEIKRHASILADCIMQELDKVYESYTPVTYERSYGLYNSLFIGNSRIDISSKGAKLSIKVCFDDNALHRSFDGKDVNTAILINEGWQTHGTFSNVPYLGYRKGTHFIERGIERYKNAVDKPFEVRFAIS